MSEKQSKLDDATLEVMKKILSTPPKHHDEMKVGRTAKKKPEEKPQPKGRDASSKPRGA